MNDLKKKLKGKGLYCIVVPFLSKKQLKHALPAIKSSRNDNLRREWWVDYFYMDVDDYLNLMKKSESLEMLNELEDKNEELL